MSKATSAKIRTRFSGLNDPRRRKLIDLLSKGSFDEGIHDMFITACLNES